MKPTIVNRRGRPLASLTATMGLCLGMASVVSAPAQSAEPAGDCAPRVPVSVTKGEQVTGLTVTGAGSSTAPEGFTGEVLGILEDGIGPDLDMVMIRLSSPEIDRVGGIWQGMSGSPVYGEQGELIGAVAYGLAWGPTPVAGITPFEDMARYLDAAPVEKVAVGARAARVIASSTDVTAAQAEEGFAPLPMPMGVSGVRANRLEQATSKAKGHRWMPTSAYRMGAAAAPGDPTAAGPETIAAGGNLAASLSYGDITQAGIGTATSVCNGRVVGFGHPLAFLGSTTLTMHPAEALYIQEDRVAPPFKVANFGAPAGTITDDRLTGITGSFGARPDTTGITSSVSYLDRERTGTSNVSVARAAASTTFFEFVGNHDRVLDSIVAGSELLSWTITGHDAAGEPFSLSVVDRYASDFDISFESAWELADFVWALSSIKGVTIDDVTMDSDVVDDNSTWEVKRVEQRRAGEWLTINRRNPALARAGKELKVRAVLESGSDTRAVPLSVPVPGKAAGQRARLSVMGGNVLWSEDGYPRSLDQAQEFVENQVRNDQVVAELNAFGRRGMLRGTAEAPPQDRVVNGGKNVRVFVR
jgi:hypothetical protein